MAGSRFGVGENARQRVPNVAAPQQLKLTELG
jgi:hypothetical protein